MYNTLRKLSESNTNYKYKPPDNIILLQDIMLVLPGEAQHCANSSQLSGLTIELTSQPQSHPMWLWGW